MKNCLFVVTSVMSLLGVILTLFGSQGGEDEGCEDSQVGAESVTSASLPFMDRAVHRTTETEDLGGDSGQGATCDHNIARISCAVLLASASLCLGLLVTFIHVSLIQILNSNNKMYNFSIRRK